MATANSDISVIICTYTEERWDDLLAAVTSLQKQTLPPCETIVVVDHNTRLFERVQAHISHVLTIENSAARGLSGARNAGLMIARGVLIAFLDDDAEAEPDWLEYLHRSCLDHQVLGVGGTVIPHWLSKRPVWFPTEFYWVVGCSYQKIPEQPVIVRNPYGGCTCIKQEVFVKVGGFREDIGRVGTLPLGGEETEFSIRATQRWPQKVFLYEPQARIHHRIPARRAQWSYFASRCYAEGLSKALIIKYVGTKDSLSSERAYTLHTLPLGVIRGLSDVILRRDLTGLLRAGAIVAGLAITTSGYLKGYLTYRFLSQKTINASMTHEVPLGLGIQNEEAIEANQ